MEFRTKFVCSVVFSMLISSALATLDTLQRRGPTCTNITIAVPCTATNTALPSDISRYNLLTFVNSLISLTFTSIVSGPFNISATYCEPALYNASRANTLQFLNHGALYTKAYWFGDYLDTRYSWVDYASQQGFPTLSIDRLGNGASEHPDPIADVQYPTEVEIAHQIILLARSGSLPAPAAKIFSKIIYIGHSYGSVIGNNLNLHHPADCDATIHTGFSSVLTTAIPGVLAQAGVLPADVADPIRYGGLDVGYLELTSLSGFTTLLFGPAGSYDVNVLLADFNMRGTISVGEAATIAFGTSTAAAYTGPVFVMNGQHDTVFCSGLGLNLGLLGLPPQCTGGLLNFMEATRTLYPSSSSFSYYILPSSGHCWELHYEAYAAFGVAHQWLSDHGY